MNDEREGECDSKNKNGANVCREPLGGYFCFENPESNAPKCEGQFEHEWSKTKSLKRSRSDALSTTDTYPSFKATISTSPEIHSISSQTQNIEPDALPPQNIDSFGDHESGTTRKRRRTSGVTRTSPAVLDSEIAMSIPVEPFSDAQLRASWNPAAYLSCDLFATICKSDVGNTAISVSELPSTMLDLASSAEEARLHIAAAKSPSTLPDLTSNGDGKEFLSPTVPDYSIKGFSSSGPGTSLPASSRPTSPPSLPSPKINSVLTALVLDEKPPSYKNLFPPAMVPNTEHQTPHFWTSHVYHYQSPPAPPITLHQNQDQNSQNVLYYLEPDDVLYPPSDSLDLEQKLQFSYTEPYPSRLDSVPLAEQSSSPSPASQIQHNSPTVQQHADIIFDLLTQELRAVHSKHQTQISHLHAALARMENLMLFKEAEVENRLNISHLSALAIKQRESEDQLRRTKSDMEAAYKQQIDSLAESFKAAYQEKLARAVVQPSETNGAATEEPDSTAKHNHAHVRNMAERLMEVEAKLEKATRAHNEEIARLKMVDDLWKRENSVVEMRRQWEEEKRTLQACIEEERKKRLLGEAREKLKEKEEAKKMKILETAAQDAEKRQNAIDASRVVANSCIGDPNQSEVAKEKERFYSTVQVAKQPAENGQKTVSADRHELDEEKQKENLAFLEQESNFEQAKQEFDEAKKRQEDWVERMKCMLLRQVETEKQRIDDYKRGWEQSRGAATEKEKKEAETQGYQQAMAKMQQEVENWKVSYGMRRRR
ncbi:hypothetical protein GALMADRAFT_255087 [Galerina marginata CBS 339.88]|uniref:Uncharacterized protein n=1 Tax=Galerina marginata (strain CBS 339.88) TaxID=685588 RepID=A0A067SH27_GALM3|nr:hypothetical protein GALMADRAFT_255087 [Galerina marginata CBS 339.88]